MIADEWRELGFFHDCRGASACWWIVGSAVGLAGFTGILDEYVRDPKNETVSECEVYGPRMSFKIETAEEPEVDREGVRGSLADLDRLKTLVASGLENVGVGESFDVASEYSTSSRFRLEIELREPAFDPASADPGCASRLVDTLRASERQALVTLGLSEKRLRDLPAWRRSAVGCFDIHEADRIASFEWQGHLVRHELLSIGSCPNGDVVAIELASGDDLPVVYVSHEGGGLYGKGAPERVEVSSSLSRFLDAANTDEGLPSDYFEASNRR